LKASEVNNNNNREIRSQRNITQGKRRGLNSDKKANDNADYNEEESKIMNQS
jgi:hypothetical protein